MHTGADRPAGETAPDNHNHTGETVKKNPTKADLAAEAARLAQENAQMRDLLAAVSLAAGTVPVSEDNDWAAEWKRSTRVLASIKSLSRLDDGHSDWKGYLAYAAGELRSLAAEPAGYEVYQPAPVITDSERDCPEGNPASGAWCHLPAPHGEHRDTDGETWTTADEHGELSAATLYDPDSDDAQAVTL